MYGTAVKGITFCTVVFLFAFLPPYLTVNPFFLQFTRSLRGGELF